MLFYVFFLYLAIGNLLGNGPDLLPKKNFGHPLAKKNAFFPNVVNLKVGSSMCPRLNWSRQLLCHMYFAANKRENTVVALKVFLALDP